ncbi:MAG: hypothetical protein CV089_03415 [Nitrospira sp. WS110]|nr:hypothetical protein [Nitrospira sp. WS110]
MVSQQYQLAAFTACALLLLTIPHDAGAQTPEGSQATTELSCSFSMEKGETAQPCHVPFPQGCRVANFPGSTQPWTTISKGGRFQCRFDEKKTNWKANIVGSCGRCQSVRCSAQFSVRFDCSTQP